jgi:hypothetical protein
MDLHAVARNIYGKLELALRDRNVEKIGNFLSGLETLDPPVGVVVHNDLAQLARRVQQAGWATLTLPSFILTSQSYQRLFAIRRKLSLRNGMLSNFERLSIPQHMLVNP